MDLKRAFSVLKLTSCKSEADLKAAFYRLAHDYHPDKNPTEEAQHKFREAVLAYEFCLAHWHLVLQSDAARTTTVQPVFESFEQIFSDLFGYSASGRILGFHPPFDLALFPEEMTAAVHKTQWVRAYKKCRTCQGHAQIQGPNARLCRYCFGQGRIAIERLQDVSQKICPKCVGRGREVEKPCPSCDGYGRTRVWRRLTLDLPQGLKPGELMALSLNLPRASEPIEVFLRVVARTDGIFRIENLDLICDYPLNFRATDFWKNDYVLQTRSGMHRFRVGPQAKPGDHVVLPGLGLYRERGSEVRGNVVVVLQQSEPFWRSWFRRYGG